MYDGWARCGQRDGRQERKKREAMRAGYEQDTSDMEGEGQSRRDTARGPRREGGRGTAEETRRAGHGGRDKQLEVRRYVARHVQ